MNLYLLPLVLLLIQPGQDAPIKKRTGIAARVNDEIITWEEIYAKLRGFKAESLTKELLDGKLRLEAEQRLFLQEAKAKKIRVSDRELDQAIARVVRAVGGKKRFESYLRYKSISKNQHREIVRRDLMERKLYGYMIRKGAVGSDSLLLVESVPPAEIRAYYNKHKKNFKSLQHCDLFRIGLQFRNPREKVFKERLAQSLLRKLNDSTDMFLLAQYYSDVRRKGSNGASDFMIRQLKKKNEFFDAKTTKYLFEELPVRTFSRVVEDGNTFNIFWLVERVNKPAESFEEAQLKIRNELENRNRQANRKILRDKLLEKAYIEPKDLFK